MSMGLPLLNRLYPYQAGPASQIGTAIPTFQIGATIPSWAFFSPTNAHAVAHQSRVSTMFRPYVTFASVLDSKDPKIAFQAQVSGRVCMFLNSQIKCSGSGELKSVSNERRDKVIEKSTIWK